MQFSSEQQQQQWQHIESLIYALRLIGIPYEVDKSIIQNVLSGLVILNLVNSSVVGYSYHS